jgi:hypothetical protein
VKVWLSSEEWFPVITIEPNEPGVEDYAHEFDVRAAFRDRYVAALREFVAVQAELETITGWQWARPALALERIANEETERGW